MGYFKKSSLSLDFASYQDAREAANRIGRDWQVVEANETGTGADCLHRVYLARPIRYGESPVVEALNDLTLVKRQLGDITPTRARYSVGDGKYHDLKIN